MLAQWTHVHSGRGRRDEGYAWARQYRPLLIKANKPITTAMCPSIQPQEPTLSFSEDTIPWRGASQPLGADSLHSTPSFMERAAICFLNFLKLIFLEIGEGKKKGRETSISCLSHVPQLGPNPQSGHMPWLRIKPATFHFVGWCPTNWAIPVRTAICFQRTKYIVCIDLRIPWLYLLPWYSTQYCFQRSHFIGKEVQWRAHICVIHGSSYMSHHPDMDWDHGEMICRRFRFGIS